MSGCVVLVGAGPGDPDLLTVRGLRELRRAEVLLYDALIEPAILELARPECERIDVGKRGDGTRGVSQDEIAALLVRKAREGRYVVRLKGGDPFVFGRGGEEASALVEAGVPFEVVPGISSVLAAPAYAGIPVTDRRLSSSVAIVTGHRGKQLEDRRNDWEGLAQSAETLVVLMGTTWLEDIVRRVLDGGRDPSTPACVIADGTTGRQRVVRAPLGELARRVREAGLRAPTVILIGEVARFRESLAWFEQRPLFGRRVLVLRAEEQRAELVEQLARRGAQPLAVPLLRFEESGKPEELDAALSDPGAYDWVVFTSANAVRFAARYVAPGFAAGADRGAARARVACIGGATASAARRAGIPVDLEPADGASAAELARELAGGAALEGARVLLPRGASARDTLRAALAERGARVDCVEVYRNALPPDAAPRLCAALEEGVDAVMLTSPSTVERLARLIGLEQLRALAGRAVLVCIGPTTEAALRERGIGSALVAERRSSEGLVQALERHYEEGGDAVS